VKREAKSPDAGVTMAELLVVLAILGLVTGVSGLAVASLRVPAAAERENDLRRARAEAIQSGREIVVDSVRFLPDGRAIGPGVDPLTGAVNAR
jgi:prepilin-type N-terminal cleavage/methylation domain-containing protein